MASQPSIWALLCVCFIVIISVSVEGNRKPRSSYPDTRGFSYGFSFSQRGHKEEMLKTHKFYCPSTNCSQNLHIIWVKAEDTDKSSTIHYLWTTYPVPTIVVAYTTRQDVEAKVDCAMLTNNTHQPLNVSFSPGVNYTFGFAMPRIYEYNDDNDDVDVSDNTYLVLHEFTENTTWEMDFDKNASEVVFTTNDSVIFKFVASSSEGRGSRLPHLHYTADSNRFSLTLDNVNITTNNTRFAVEINYIVSGDSEPDVTSERSIDDEYTPAVFKTVYGKVNSEHGKVFSQWKPIAYTKAELGRKSQTKASESGIRMVNRSWNIAEVVMKYQNFKVYGLNVSFGLAKDGFYQKNQYLTWSGIVGYGKPATQGLSFLVILIISIGVGLPLVIIVFGGTFVQVRKRYRRSDVNTSYARIN